MTIATENNLLPRSKGFETQPEVLNPVECNIKGKIPSWVQGVLYRAGPGTYDVDQVNGKKYEIQHWFDGLAQIHRFEINNDKVTYMSRNTSPDLHKHIEQGGDGGVTFAQDVCQLVFSKDSSVMQSNPEPVDPKTTANNNVVIAVDYPGVKNPEVITVLTDANRLQDLDWKTLEPKGFYTYAKFNSKFTGVFSAAHPSTDPFKQETWQFTTELGPKPGYNIIVISNENPEGELVTFLEAKPAYIHSSFITEKYFIFAIPSYYVDAPEMMKRRNMVGALKFDETAATEFYVFDRAAKKLVATYHAPASFFFHSINAYDKDDTVVLDVVGYDDASVVESLYFAKLLQRVPSSEKFKVQETRRYTLTDISSGEEPTTIRKVNFTRPAPGVYPELPRVNDDYFTKPYTFFYALNLLDPSLPVGATGNSLSKANVETGEYLIWKEDNCLPGEPIFIADPNGQEEDDGVLLSVVLDEVKGASFLAVINAKNMEEIARAEVNSVVPFGFHGAFKY